jgi:hypothetical protein
MTRIPCINCGALILPTTAQRTDGLCMPCKKASRLREDGLFSGGDGSTLQTAIVVDTDNNSLGIQAEYEYLARHCGAKQRDWELESQEVTQHIGKHYDILRVKFRSGELRLFHFDISRFYRE